MENGSGGFLSDLRFEGGKFGMWVGNQQFTSRNIVITGALQAGIYLNWDWVWSFKGLNITNVPVAIDVRGGQSRFVVSLLCISMFLSRSVETSRIL